MLDRFKDAKGEITMDSHDHGNLPCDIALVPVLRAGGKPGQIRGGNEMTEYGEAIGREGLDNDAAIEGDAVLMTMQERIDLQVLGYHDSHNGLEAALPANHDYMTGYRGAEEGLVM